MPYVDREDRARLGTIPVPHTPGELNYLLTAISVAYIDRKGKNYTHLNDVMGALDSAGKEFYRRVIAPYEEEKIEENGDVYLSILL